MHVDVVFISRILGNGDETTVNSYSNQYLTHSKISQANKHKLSGEAVFLIIQLNPRETDRQTDRGGEGGGEQHPMHGIIRHFFHSDAIRTPTLRRL